MMVNINNYLAIYRVFHDKIMKLEICVMQLHYNVFYIFSSKFFELFLTNMSLI